MYQPFIIEKSKLILDILKDDIKVNESSQARLCDFLTEKFIKGELSEEDPINMIFDENELLSFINLCLIDEELNHLAELGLVDSYKDNDNDEPIYYLTENGSKIANEIKNEIRE